MKQLARRVERLERKLAAVPAPVDPEEGAQREARTMELCAAAVAGREPEDLTEEERELFAKLVLYVPAYLELLEAGALDRHGDLRRHHDGDRDGGLDVLHDKDARNDAIKSSF